ncbi:transposase [Streptomyces sp. NEAU-S7GS2]|uniref:transposase n=1 Tax=Streptomyces sp. NEAU-S7GS2 TaxID=2202000 RepID=UPI0026842AFE
MFEPFGRADQRRWGAVYLRGLLLSGGRKSVEPMAARSARRGGKRAMVAVMHKLAIAIWYVLHDRVLYRELGADYFTKRDPARPMRRMTKEADSLGLVIRFEPIPTA